MSLPTLVVTDSEASNLEGPVRAGTSFPVTFESTHDISFRGSILRGSEKDFRPAFAMVRLLNSSKGPRSLGAHE
jgi:hypothetical protein